MVHMTSDARYSPNDTRIEQVTARPSGESTLRMSRDRTLSIAARHGPRRSSPAHRRPARAVTVRRERSRLEWRLGDGGDPAELARRLPRRTTDCRCATLAERRPKSHPDGAGTSAARRCSSRPPPAPRWSAAPSAAPSPGPGRARRGRRRLRPRRPAGRPPRRPGRRRAGAVAARAVAGELDAATSTPPRSRRSARRSPAATSTRSTSSATPRAPYLGDPLPALRRVGRPARRPLRRRAAPATAGRSAARRRRPWSRSRGGRVVTRPIKGTRPATAAGRARAARLGQGTRRARHDRRPGAQRPGPGRPHRHGAGRRAVRGAPLVPTCGRPSRRCRAAAGRRRRPGRPAAGGLPGRLGHRRAEARRAGRRSPRWSRSAAAPSMGALGWVGAGRPRPRA